MGNLLLDGVPKNAPIEMYLAKVTRFNISSDTVDVVSIDDDISLLNCQVLCAMPAGFSFGTKYVPSHNNSNLETGYVHSPGDIYCVAAFLGDDYNNAVILGFLFPKETVLSIPDYGLYIFRHESDVMWMVRGDGTAQMYHPSGSIIKIGSDDSNEMSESIMIPTKADGFHVRDATDYNNNKTSNLVIDWYKGQKVKLDSDGNIIINTKNTAGSIVTTLTMTFDGKVTIETTEQINLTTQDINVTASGDVTANVTGNTSINVTGSVDVTANEANIDSPAINLTTNPGGLKMNGVVGFTGAGHVLTSQNGIVTNAHF